jgi:hypothetical protein
VAIGDVRLAGRRPGGVVGGGWSAPAAGGFLSERASVGYYGAPLNRVKPRPFGVRAALVPALAIAAVALLPALLRPWIRVRADSWFHAAVVAEIEAFGVPPQDPYFAGLPLQYMWAFHALLAGVRRLVPLSPFDLMAAVNAVALVATLLAAAALARRLGQVVDDGPGAEPGAPIESPPSPARLAAGDDPTADRAARWSLVLVPFALGALFWALLPIRALRAAAGSSSGGDELARLFRLAPLDIPTTRAFLSDFGSIPFFLNKYLVGTAYGLALAAFLVYLVAIVRYAGRPGLRALLVAGAALTTTLFLHPVVGLTTTAVSGLVGLSLLALGPRRGGLPFGKLLGWGLAVATALAVAGPYLVAVTGRTSGAPLAPIHFDWVNLVGLLLGCALVLLLALEPARSLWRGATAPGRLMVLWCVATLLFAAVVRLPGPNTTDKFTYLLYLPLAALASVGAARRLRGARAAWLLVLALLPVNLIGWAGYWFDPDDRVRSPDIVAAYDWLARETPRDALVLDSNDRCDVVASVPRRQFWGREAYAEQWGYDPGEMNRRRAARDAVYAPGPLDVAALAPLEALPASLYILVRQGDLGKVTFGGWGKRFRGRAVEVFARPGIRIYRYGGMIPQ